MSDSEDENGSSPVSSSAESTGGGAPDWPVTEQWLEAVLRDHHLAQFDDCKQRTDDNADHVDIAVSEFTVRPGCDAGESVLSDILAVGVSYTVNGAAEEHRLSLIVKLLPQDPFSRFFVTEAQFDLREIKFYTQVVPDLELFRGERLSGGLPIPRCFHAHYSTGATTPSCDVHRRTAHSDDDDGGGAAPPLSARLPPESALVLEDARPLGYRSADFSQGLTLHQAEAALVAVAKVHAMSLAYKIVEGVSLRERYPFLFQTARATDSYQQLVERGLPQLARFLERRPGLEPVLAALNNLREHTKELIASLLAPREPLALITHTDFWCNNLMFRGNGQDEDDTTTTTTDDECVESRACSAIILDWQMVTYSRPTNDVALLLVSSLSGEARRKHTDRLVDAYWCAFTSGARSLGVDVERDLGYDRSALNADLRRSRLLALLLCIGSVDVALGDPRTEQRLIDALQDLHEDGVLTPEIADD